MSQGRAPKRGEGETSLLGIGEVLARLRSEFPDTTISKLRFLESEGLVRPQRTASGYRKYSGDDVSRLRYVLFAQRDQYLPLRVIRQHLDSGAHITRAQAAQPPAHPGQPAPRAALVAVPQAPGTAPRLARQELCDRAQISAELLADLESHGLVAERSGGGFDTEAVTIAEVAGQLAGYGIGPRHLRSHKLAADREVDLFSQVAAPLLRQQAPSGQARAEDAIRELMLLSQRLHLALLRSGLSDTLG